MDRWTTFRSCDRAREAVSRGLDGELSPFEERLLSAHLLRCASCREFEATAAALTNSLRTAELQPLEQPIALPRRRSLRPLHGSAAAAVAAAAVLILSVAGPVGFEETQDRLSAPTRPIAPRIVEDGDPFPADHARPGATSAEDVAVPE